MCAIGHDTAGPIAIVPVNPALAGLHLAGHQRANFLALQVVARQLRGTGFQHAEGKARGGFEGIRTILLQLERGETAPVRHL